MRDHLKLKDDERRHISAKELVEGMKALAVEQFGNMARGVWESWGVHETGDWGSVIYNLIDAELMRQNDGDSIEDFKGVYDFDAAFGKEWRLGQG